ncbi:MAG: hypothetical protein QM775_31330 [Pirellulales bacterium]
MSLIQYPLIHVAIAGLLVCMLGRALVRGEVGGNVSTFRRETAPVRYWLGVALGCGLLYVVAEPVVRELWK